ncbi:MAG: alpha/beta fold hydrolase [Chloroflexi bacterium]|nr:alpha/beta fold hydrolase [Chloroflexota bacterium]
MPAPPPLTVRCVFEQMADDIAAAMEQIGLEKADVFGYSLGGGVALQVAIRHPERVNKLIVVSATYESTGWHADLQALFPMMTAEMFAGSPMEAEYQRLSPNPENFAGLVDRIVELETQEFAWPAVDIQGITAPTLIVAGDSDLGHAGACRRAVSSRGGGVNGDLAGLPQAQLAILPGTTHTSVLIQLDWLTGMVNDFLNGVVRNPFAQ